MARQASNDARHGATRPGLREDGPATTSEEYIPGTQIRVLRSVDAMRAFRSGLSSQDSVGLVPTMGALHEGHARLIRAAAGENDSVVVSIYVNPAQFGIREDLDSYPVTWDGDCRVLAGLNAEFAAEGAKGRIEAVFVPTTREMYPSGFPGQEVDSQGSFVTITPEGSVLEGASRPTFFRGVATVVMKLFAVAQPRRAYFGQKDAQQTVVVRKMARDFLLPVEVRVVPTAREEDGLAKSSRNAYLGERRRRVATVLHRALLAARERFGAGERSREAVLAAAKGVLDSTLAEQMRLPPSERVRFELDYISAASPDTMQEVDPIDPHQGAILSGAVRFLPVEEPREGEDLGHSGGPLVRLIDNVLIEPEENTPAAA
ncbi:Pantoate-beta-alanine ligase [Pleurostoma richardsiae]|uniref:Pantoate--beta-alanine ligase n=1 Tax=Pleurostoma richardsiae TaxID=41990 RepID=A0AA38RMS8_9PEZI|nr:Pantoate-beta-alanine ligase [Pleurostoma richardsiae]